jgi:uncharacterized protein YybS (DUF2232 family)
MQRFAFISKFILALGSSVFLFLGGISLPPLGVIVLPFVAQPVLLFAVKYSMAGGMAMLCLGILLFVLFATKELALIYAVFAALAGLLLGLLGRIRVIEYLVISVATALFALIGLFALHLYGSWSLMSHDLHAALSEQLASAIRMQESMGVPPEGLEMLRGQTPQIIATMMQLLPALVFLSFAVVTLVNILYLGRRFPERRAQWFSLRYLREWRGPEPVVWGLIACGFSLFVPGIPWARTVALNLLLIIGAFYFAQGLAVIAYFFHKNNVPRFLRALTYVLIVFQQIFTLLVVGLGLFDLWGDFRHLRKNNPTPQAS